MLFMDNTSIINVGEHDAKLSDYSVVPVLHTSTHQLSVVFDWLLDSIDCIVKSQLGTTVRLPDLPLSVE
jgi:hypothetical protein